MKEFIAVFCICFVFFSFSCQSYGNNFESALPCNRNLKVVEEGNIIFSENITLYDINGLSFFRLRDLGSIMDFSVEYSKNTIYIKTSDKSSDQFSNHINNGLKKAVLSKENLFIDGKECNSITAYKIDGYNYYSIREICEVIGFHCEWNEKENLIMIERIFNETNFIEIIDENFIFNPENVNNLTQILEKNIDEFDSNLFKVEMINNTVYGKNYYEVIYIAKVNEYKLPYSIIVFIEDNQIQYVKLFSANEIKKIKKFEDKLSNLNIDKDIKVAKREALRYVPETATVDYQNITINIDNEFNLHLTVKTACVDEDGTSRFVLSYEYKIS